MAFFQGSAEVVAQRGALQHVHLLYPCIGLDTRPIVELRPDGDYDEGVAGQCVDVVAN